MFASRWAVSTVPESNEKGSWYGWSFAHLGYLKGPTDPLFVMARDLYRAVSSGKMSADMSRAPEAQSRPDVDPEARPRPAVDPETGESTDEDDDVPF
jgi:hypothetical protein